MVEFPIVSYMLPYPTSCVFLPCHLLKEIRLVVRRVSQCLHCKNFISVVKLSTSLCPSEFPGNGIWIWGNRVQLGEQFCPRGPLAVSGDTRWRRETLPHGLQCAEQQNVLWPTVSAAQRPRNPSLETSCNSHLPFCRGHHPGCPVHSPDTQSLEPLAQGGSLSLS